MQVTKENFPNIVEAFHALDQDSSGPRALCLPLFVIPAIYDEHLPKIEQALASLSRTERSPEAEPLPDHVKPDAYADSEFFAFCCGEYEETQAIANRSLDFQLANNLLNDYFEDYIEMPGDPLQRAYKSRIEFLDKSGGTVEAEQLRFLLK